MTKIIVTGATGRLGRWTVPELKKAGFKVLGLDSNLDVRNKEEIKKTFSEFKPDVVLHLAAFTGIPTCENNKRKAWEVNVVGTKNVVDASGNAFLILMSTPCVFEGAEGVEYSEDDIPNPQNFYGLTKLLSERIVLDNRGIVVRGNFVPYEKWPHPKAFSDRFSNYLFSHNIGKAFVDIINNRESSPEIIHVVGDRNLSMYELAKMCPESENVEEFTLKEYYKNNPEAAKLTKNMSLQSKKWKKYKISEPQ